MGVDSAVARVAIELSALPALLLFVPSCPPIIIHIRACVRSLPSSVLLSAPRPPSTGPSWLKGESEQHEQQHRQQRTQQPKVHPIRNKFFQAVFAPHPPLPRPGAQFCSSHIARLSPPAMEANAENLAGAVLSIRNEVDALRSCLLRAGVLRHEQYIAEVHRCRFAAVQREHSSGPGRHLTDTLQEGGLVERLSLQYRPWEITALAPASRAGRPLAQAIAAAWLSRRRALVCVCGGVTGRTRTASMEGFDLERSAWETLPQMNTARAGVAVAVLRNQLYICGGEDGDDNVLSYAERFDPERNLWEVLPPMGSERYSAKAVAMGGRLYICGGTDADAHSLSSAERFDPDRNLWEALPPMTSERYGAAAVAVGGRLYICGGSDSQHRELSSAERFDPDRNQWEALPPMGSERFSAAAAAVGGRLYMCGGGDADGDVLWSAERFDPDRNQWEALAPMGSERYGAVAAAVGGRLYICGGRDSQGFLSSVECFDPERSYWETQPPMSLPRALGAAATFWMPRPTPLAYCIGSPHAGRGSDGQAPVSRRRLG